MINGHMFSKFIKNIDGAISRADGDNNPITNSED